MRLLSRFSSALALLLLHLSALTPGRAADIYTSGHGDIGVGYDAGEFEPHWHLGGAAIVNGSPLGTGDEFAPGDIIARTSATRLSAIGLSNILGVADGTEIYAAGSSTYQPNLGLSVEELDPANWVGDITLSLSGWSLPAGGQFALYTTNLAGTSVVDRLFSTFNPAATDFGNSLPLTPGDHAHFQWGFTAPGTYELDFTWSGTHVVDGLISTTDTFSVSVIPEPSTLLMLGLALAAGLTLPRRRR